ncbi:hypothetical protein A6R68_22663 [Neotoma lepida]|uniref:Small ribosomal subunit protein uS5 n=1 Tax=Neotoma lepida TaxID=56216 RepID=A0A1A6HYN4_NEOLE|nr:hypothetical protein A6R68_22663 [Neotoma lepida]
MKIKSLEKIYLFSLPIKESKIIGFFLGASLKDEVLKIMPVQKQTLAGQWARDIGIVSAPGPKKVLLMASIGDCYTSARGCTATMGNFAKATFDAISKTSSYLTPDLWKETGVHRVSGSGIHRSSCENLHQSLCSEDPGSSCGHHRGVFIQEK